jgi:dTDP-4-dehydrorhamnose reductase
MDKLLVVGVDTLAGANFALASSARFEVLGLCPQRGRSLEGIAVEQAAELDATLRHAEHFGPDWIVHCGRLSASSWDLPATDPAWECEPKLVHGLLDCARAHNARLTVLLTDAVFSGPRMFHDESSPTGSAHPAATTALAIEQTLADTIALVVRTHTYGWAPAGCEAGTVERLWQWLVDGASASPDGRRYATPILASDLADLLHRAYELNVQGLLHVTGAERTSPFRMAVEMAVAFGLPVPRSGMGVVDSAADEAAWLSETSLSSRRARRTLELPMPMLREGLQRFAEQARDGWRQRMQQPGHTPDHTPAHEQAA